MGPDQALFQWNLLHCHKEVVWWWSGVMVELVVTDGWFVSVITNNSESSLVDSSNCCFWRLRQSLVWAISCKHFPSQEALLWAILARACTAYSSILATQVRVTPAYLPSQMARSFSGISAVSCDMNLYSVHVEWHSLLLRGAGSLLASTSEAHWLASPNSCMSHCLSIMPLVGVMPFNHIQMSTLDRLSDLSSSCWMVVHPLGYAAIRTAWIACHQVCPP